MLRRRTKQHANGGYYNGSTDYTSVIYPAKSIMELAHVEKRLKEDETLSKEQRDYFAERYGLHMDSLTRAMDRLVSLDRNFDTEGQGTFEDGANSCSATQYDAEMKLTCAAPNMMNSPHGWSAWNIYALFNIYELTGVRKLLFGHPECDCKHQCYLPNSSIIKKSYFHIYVLGEEII